MKPDTPISEYDMQRCPQCSGTRIVAQHETQVLHYGEYPQSVMLIFSMPVIHCLNAECKLSFMDHTGEKAQTEAIAKYRRILCPTPNIERWWKENGDILQHSGPEGIIKAWEKHRTQLEAGEGIEPPTSGV